MPSSRVHLFTSWHRAMPLVRNFANSCWAPPTVHSFRLEARHHRKSREGRLTGHGHPTALADRWASWMFLGDGRCDVSVRRGGGWWVLLASPAK